MLIKLLSSLTEEQWQSATIARLWTVKDIAAHLLDGNIRTLSISRDQYFGEKPGNINSYADLVAYLNKLNHDWTTAASRLSPKLLIQLLENTGKQYAKHLNTLQPFDDAVFSVAWAGHDVSPNWFHIAREYTEKFLHQQQIRDAVGNQALFTKKLYKPFLETFMQALPYTYRNVEAANGTIVSVTVTGKAGGKWYIINNGKGWELIKKIKQSPAAIVRIDAYDAWQVFSKGITPLEAESRVKISGDAGLAKVALGMIAVMA
ncbi:MAG: maleylpyruvate isomerase N-terminal domain-containing protein [Rhizobacter sp.]|nr:maleylpyruvate isomerase N-terminal domain-containing protein [Ferruginibacter sp.]